MQRALKRQRAIVTKAYTVGSAPIPASAARQDESPREQIFSKAKALDPPYPLEIMAALIETSNALRQNIDAYAVNIDGFGHRFEPAINLDQDSARDLIIDAILMERIGEAKRKGKKPDIKTLMPSDEEVNSRSAELRLRSRVEKAQLDCAFRFIAQGMSFPKLRKQTRQDLELLGNGYWEVLRNFRGELARFVYVPAWTMRLLPLLPEFITINERVAVSPVKFGTVQVKRQFRTFVQVADNTSKPIYFKEFGDPRIVSRTNGKVFPDADSLKKENPQDEPATEIIHFKIHNPLSPYGVPRWMGNLLSVLGSRAAEEVNYLYFDNKAIPPMAILVSGGRLSKTSIDRIEDTIENLIKGKRNFHKILIIEAVSPRGRSAEGGPQPQRPMIQIEKLKDQQNDDALFQKYDEANLDKVGSAFRLPRLLRGESKDFNRATAEAALRMAEDQVFEPERDDFDFFVNHQILPELDATFWSFKSNSPVSRSPEVMGKILEALLKQGAITPEEARVLAGDIFNRDFAVINEPWTKQPVQFTLAGIQTGQTSPVSAGKMVTTGDLSAGGAIVPAQGDPPKIPSITGGAHGPEELARMLMRIRSAIASTEARLEIEDRDGDVIKIEITPEEMDELVERD